MNEIYAIKKDTPHVRAIKVSDRIAKYPCEGMPQIYHKEFDLHEFIGEEIAGIRGVNSVHYFPVLFEDMDTVLSMKNDSYGSIEKAHHVVQWVEMPDVLSKCPKACSSFL